MPLFSESTVFGRAVAAIRDGGDTDRDAAAKLVAQLSDDELLWLLDGDQSMFKGLGGMMTRYNEVPYPAGAIERLGIPGILFVDGPRGVVTGEATAFPVSISRAASWDVALEERIGDAIGKETRAAEGNTFAGVCVNIPPFPGWGRSQEAYGEDSYLVGRMGAALVEGVSPWAMATVKHFALNSMDEARFFVDVRVDEATMREAYLPHFQAAIDAGADGVMSAYNSVNGEWAGQHKHLLTEVLRDDWGFPGFVMTDFVWGLRDPIGSVAAGQDVEMPVRMQRARSLPKALRDGRLAREDIVRAGERLIAAQLRLAARALPDPEQSVTASPQHRSLAREAAARGTVLLKNIEAAGHALLPLQEDAVTTVAVVGRHAGQPNLGDNGSSKVHPPSTVSILDGLRERLGSRLVEAEDDDVAIGNADAVVVVVGMGPFDEGEAFAATEPDALALFGGPMKWKWLQRVGAKFLARQMAKAEFGGGDRSDLHLLPEDVALINRITALNKRTIVVLIGGGTLMLDPWDNDVAAILHAWYPGMEGGRAIADVLFGDREPTGRLPLAIPARREDLPVVDWQARTVDYPRWFGQQKLDRDAVTAAYPLGFGLGYTTFEITDLTCEAPEGNDFVVHATVRNTGARAGRHVVQIYAMQDSDHAAPRRALVGFTSIELDAGATAVVDVACSTTPLQRWIEDQFRLTVPTVTLQASSYAGDPEAVSRQLTLTTQVAR